MSRVLLGVNIDHIATVRNARGGPWPCPVEAALIAEDNGADGITAHLREDRRHIKDADMRRLALSIGTRLNFEMAVTDEMVSIACEISPAHSCWFPKNARNSPPKAAWMCWVNFSVWPRRLSG